MIRKVVITIPLYKSNISKSEMLALNQLINVLKNHQINFFTFKELDFSQYSELLQNVDYSITYFKKFFFKDTLSYSKLLCSKSFYKKYKNYKYLLLYQLDAWVFRDELAYWVGQNYDYIGAPWFSDDNPEFGLPHFLGIGNGGFSLRNIKNHLRVLSNFSYIISPFTIINNFISEPSFTSFLKMIKYLTFSNNSHFLLGKPEINEDVFWGTIVKRNYSWFKAPDMITAARFSTETNSEKLYQINKQTPFGCHAWEIYDFEFWSTHILINDKVAK